MEESDSSQQPKRCPCGFWGSSQTSGLCSKCYKATVQEKSQSEGLDAKSELLRNRQSAYANHESVGAASSSYLPAGLNSASATTMEQAEELIRQAVKNSSTNSDATSAKSSAEETVKTDPVASSASNDNQGADKTGDIDNSKDKQCVVKDSAVASKSESFATSSNSDKNIDKCDTICASNASSCRSSTNVKTDANNPVPALLSPEKRGVKRDAGALEEDVTPGSTPEKAGTKSKKRCGVCKCKLELAQRTIGRCRCDSVFCSLHRLPELHNCDFDHKEDGRREAREKMVKPTRHLGTSFKRLDSDS